MVRVSIGVEGFTSEEAIAGLQGLLLEMQQRPWMAEPRVAWDGHAKRLIVHVVVEGDNADQEAERVYDEIWDCVFATIHFSGPKISFHIDDAYVVQDA